MKRETTGLPKSSASDSGPDGEAREARRKNIRRNIGYVVPRGLSRSEAAAYVGIGDSLFDTLVEAGLMPRARAMSGRVVWDRFELDDFFEVLPYHGKQKDRVRSSKEEVDAFFGIGVDPISPDRRRLGLGTEPDELAWRAELQA